jgi:hypothetical protein
MLFIRSHPLDQASLPAANVLFLLILWLGQVSLLDILPLPLPNVSCLPMASLKLCRKHTPLLMLSHTLVDPASNPL